MNQLWGYLHYGVIMLNCRSCYGDEDWHPTILKSYYIAVPIICQEVSVWFVVIICTLAPWHLMVFVSKQVSPSSCLLRSLGFHGIDAAFQNECCHAFYRKFQLWFKCISQHNLKAMGSCRLMDSSILLLCPEIIQSCNNMCFHC